MDTLSSKLLNLIKNKQLLSGNKFIQLSLGEVADTWERNVIHRYTRKNPVTMTLNEESVEEIHDPAFIKDINMALENLFDDKTISKYQALDEFKTYKPTDSIYLTSLKDFNGPQEEKEEKIFDYENCRFFCKGRTYRPNKEEKRRFIKELWKTHREENEKGKILSEGTRTPESQLAVRIDMVGSVKDFENKIKRARFKRMKKEINRILDSKNIPVHIDSETDGLLIIWTR